MSLHKASNSKHLHQEQDWELYLSIQSRLEKEKKVY